MPNDYMNAWFFGGSWYDIRQNRSIDALTDAQIAAAPRSTRAAAAAARSTADLATRVTRLEQAIVAMVSLADLREGLTAFAPAAAMRRYARDIVAQLPAFGGAGAYATVDAPADVDGYWLTNACKELVAHLSGDAAAGEVAAAAALADDPRSATIFRSCIALLAGGAPTIATLGPVWRDGPTVGQAERAFWLAVADERCLDPVTPELVGNLQHRLALDRTDGSDTTTRSGFLQVLFDALGGNATSMLKGETAMTVASLTAITTRLDELSGPLTDPTAAAAEAPPAIEEDPLAEVLVKVANRGAPAEQPIIEELAESRKALEALGIESSGVDLPTDNDLGDLGAFVVDDLTGATTTTARRALARAVVAPAVLDAARRNREMANTTPADSMTVNLASNVRVQVTERGTHDRYLIAETDGATPLGTSTAALVTAVVIALLGLGLMFVHPSFIVLTLVAAGIAAWAIEARKKTLAGQERIATENRRRERVVTEAKARLVRDRETAKDTVTAADDLVRAATAFAATGVSPAASLDDQAAPEALS